jgi:hypothetical protein
MQSFSIIVDYYSFLALLFSSFTIALLLPRQWRLTRSSFDSSSEPFSRKASLLPHCHSLQPTIAASDPDHPSTLAQSPSQATASLLLLRHCHPVQPTTAASDAHQSSNPIHRHSQAPASLLSCLYSQRHPRLTMMSGHTD